MQLLKQLCHIFSPAGNEGLINEFLLRHIEENKHRWKSVPQIITGEEFQDCILLVFGKPRTVVFAHMDSIGFTVRYDRELVKIGGPVVQTDYPLKGWDSKGEIHCKMVVQDEEQDGKTTQVIRYDYEREIDRGTELVFDSEFRETEEFVQSCYLDNRLGCWVALQLAETLENGIIAFSCWEETGGGSVSYLAKYIYETYRVNQALICDITWITKGVQHGKGVAISLRDSLIPRRSFVNKIIKLAQESGIQYQLEVENAGGSDAKELQFGPYPFNWCFVGAAEDHVHTPDEKVHKYDIGTMVALYQYLMEKL